MKNDDKGPRVSAVRRQRSPSHSELIAMQWQAERSDLDLDNFLLAIYFMRLGTVVDRAYDRYCQNKFGISGGDMRLMLALRRSGSPYVKRPTDLFKALLVTSGAITKKVDRLQAAGYVDRLTDPNHAGGFLVQLTKRGLQAVNQATDHLANESALAPAMAKLSSDERQKGIAFVLGLIADLERDALAGDEDDQG